MGNVSPATRPLPRIATVKVKVVEAKPSGIKVVLVNDGRKGFIRPREISWERRISKPPELPKRGTVLDAVILEEESRGELLFLSLRRCTYPWAEATSKQKYKVGQVVEGEVVNVRNTGAYVQIEPGIDGIISPRDAPILRGNAIEDVLWLGDKVSANVLEVDKEDHLIKLSLIQRLQSLPQDRNEHKSQVATCFGADDHPRQITLAATKPSPRPNLDIHFVRPIVRRLERVLVVDDEDEWLKFIREGLMKEYKIDVDEASNGKEAIEKLTNGTPYSLILIDLNLDGEKGTEVANTIHENEKNIPILIMSAADFEEDDKVPEKSEYPLCHKSRDALIEKIDDMCRGYWEKSRSVKKIDKGESFIHHLGMQALANGSPAEIYSGILTWLSQQTRVSYCLLLELDRPGQSVSILSSYPPLSENDLHIAQDGLYYSPVRQVIEEEREFLENDIDFESDSRFKNLFMNLDFQSCLGIPVRLPERPTRHGLFLLDEEPLSFLGGEKENAERILCARTASHFITVAIERLNLLEYMRQYEEKYSLGQLLSDMIHEVNNKLTTFEGSVGRLKNYQSTRPEDSEKQLLQEWLKKVDEEINAVSKVQFELKELAESYSRQAKNDYDAVDVNLVVEGVARQLARKAKHAGVTIFLSLAEDVPPAHATHSQLQQVVLNLALNAVQMVSRHRDLMKMVGDQSRNYLPALQTGILIIQTRCAGEKATHPVEIRVIDNGPGVHWRDQERVFAPGFSRRGGAGLGLYISRNLVERMGGRLSLFESILFMGSAFIVELLPFQTPPEKV